jgi:hypothetical protein
MLQGYIAVPIEHFGGLITNWPPEMLDVSLLVEAQNLRFTQAEAASREGLTQAFALPRGGLIGGLVDYAQLGGAELPLVYDATHGAVYVESPAGSGDLAQADPGTPFPVPANAALNGASAFNRAYLAFGDGVQGVAAPGSFDGTHLDPVTIAGPSTAISPSDSTAAGNIAAGLRYVLVLFRTRAGSLSPAGLSQASWTAAGAKQASIGNLPLGPANTAARVVAFTVAGGSSAGPYYYVGETQTVNGVTETSTIVEDNLTTSAIFNFDDAFLASSDDCTDQFRAITLPDVAAATFSQATQRMLWWGDPAQPNVVYCSEPSDAGVYFGDTGFFQVEEGSGLRVTAVFEFRNQIYAALEYGLYLITPNNGDPATWDVQQISPGIGACGPRAAAVGNGFCVLVHRTGAYQFAGGQPVLLSGELLGPASGRPGLWERINWTCESQIWVSVDHEDKCVRIGVPLDGATVCSHILKLSYLDGWDTSIRFSPFTARYHYFPGRRWSLDTIAASQAVRVRRPISLSATPSDRRLALSQMLLASAGQGGGVFYLDPDATTDNGVPFTFVLHTGAISAAQMLRQNRQGLELVGLVQMRARGSGSVTVAAVADGDEPRAFLQLALRPEASGDASGLALAQGEAVGLHISNNGAEATLRLQGLYAFTQPMWALRPR